MINREKVRVWGIRLLLFLAVAYAFTQLVSVAMGEKQRDFRTYYFATKAYLQGLNPYKIASLQQAAADADLQLPFVYPPHTLSLFAPFVSLGYAQSYYLFFLLKLAALVALVMIWMRVVPIKRSDWWALCVSVFLGYRCAVLRDIRSGNVSTFEQLALWGGILLILKRRSAFGGAMIMLSSIFKLITIALLPLLVAIRRTRRSFLVATILGLASVGGYLLLYLNQKELWVDFFSTVSSLEERGNACPSSLAFLRDTADFLGFSGSTTIYVCYALLCCVLLSILVWSFMVTRHSTDRYAMLYLTILAYVILAPRMKDYSLIIAILPTLHIFSTMVQYRWQRMVGAVLLWIPIVDYQSLLLAVLSFGVVLGWINRCRGREDTHVALTLNPLSDCWSPVSRLPSP